MRIGCWDVISFRNDVIQILGQTRPRRYHACKTDMYCEVVNIDCELFCVTMVNYKHIIIGRLEL